MPTSEIGKRSPIDLGPFASATTNTMGLNDLYWSPDGRRALFSQTTFDLGNSILELSFGRGVPKPLHQIPNIPTWGLYEAPRFFSEARGAVIQDRNTISYWLDFSGEMAVPSPLPFAEDEAASLQVCRDRRAFLTSHDATSLVYFEGQERHETELGAGDKYLSPDKNLIFIPGETAGIVRCDPSAQSASVGVTVVDGDWSEDSRHLFVQLPDGSRKLYSVSTELAVSELWSGLGVDDWQWSQGGNKLLLTRSGDTSPSYAYLDLSESSIALHELQLPGNAQGLICGADGCLAMIDDGPTAGSQLVFEAFDSASKPVPLASDPTHDMDFHSFDLDRQRIVLERSTDDGGRELMLLDYRQEPVTERPVLAWRADESPQFIQVAPDSSGIIVQDVDNLDLRWRWFPLTEADTTSVTIDVPAYVATFQPWR